MTRKKYIYGMRKSVWLLAFILCMLTGCSVTVSAQTIEISRSGTTALNMRAATIVKASKESRAKLRQGTLLEMFEPNDMVEFLIRITSGTYVISLDASTHNPNNKLRLKIVDHKSGQVEMDNTIQVTNNNNWEKFQEYLVKTPKIKSGDKIFSIQFLRDGSGYTSNVKNVRIGR